MKITKLIPSGIVQDIGAEAAKHLPSYLRYRYITKVVYHIEGKGEQTGTITGKTKKGLLESVNRQAEHAEQGRMSAWFQDGAFVGTQVAYSIGPRA